MRTIYLLLLPVLLAGREYHDPAGFRVNLPEGWRAMQSKAGHFVLASADAQRYVFLQPVRRTADCVTTLRQTLAAGGQFAGAQSPDVRAEGRGQAVARFVYQNGRSRGQMLCAETSRRSGMFYGVVAPVATFARELPGLVRVLESFRFEAAATAPSGGGGPVSLPPMVTWREPRELAYTLAVPQGWQVAGGIQRQDVTHYTDGVQAASSDGAVVRLGDQRFGSCQVPGPGAASMPNGGQWQGWCGLQSGQQFAGTYLQLLARDLGVSIQSNQVRMIPRQDLAQQMDSLPRSMGLSVQTSAVEVRFSGTRNGAPVAGALLASVRLDHAVQGQNFLLGTQTFGVTGFLGRPEQFGMLARLTGAMRSSTRVNPVWWSQTQRINQQVAQATLATMRQQAENQQREFWERMDAMDRRREGVNDILGGRVRLTDGDGNRYEAKSGSNYYFFDEEAGRRVSRPDDAVVGTDVWPSPVVDLRPLEVIR